MRVSAIIPAYNSAVHLPGALKSALEQEQPPEEIVVVDDGSTDNTAAVMAGYRDEPRIRYIRQPNGGPGAARNRGAAESSGEWLAFLDADDRWTAEKIRLQTQALSADPGAILAYSDLCEVDARGGERIKSSPAPAALWPMLRYQNVIILSTVIVRRDAFFQVGGFRAEMAGVEDWDLWCRLRDQGGFLHVAKPLTIYQLVEQSHSTNYERTLRATYMILEDTLLAGLTGWERWSWRRKILASAYGGMGWLAMQNGDTQKRRLLLRSIWLWPDLRFMPWRLGTLLRCLGGERVWNWLRREDPRWRIQ